MCRRWVERTATTADALLKGIENILEAERSIHADMIL